MPRKTVDNNPAPGETPGVATPRRPVSHGEYTGEDIRRIAVRTGSQDAFQIPSLINGRKVMPTQLREEMHAPVAPAVAIPATSSAVRRGVAPAPAVSAPRAETPAASSINRAQLHADIAAHFHAASETLALAARLLKEAGTALHVISSQEHHHDP